MDDLESMLSGILSDPAEMGKLKQMAAQLFGGASAGEEQKSGVPRTGKDGTAALVQALAPYLGQTRREKLQKALRFAKTARVAGAVLREGGVEG